MGIEARPLLPRSSSSPLVQRLLQKARDKRVPFGGSIELTHRCNLACVHCYVNLPAADRAAQRREMTTAQIKTLLDELAELGLLELTLTGGEPLLRPDFAEIYTHAHQLGMLVAVYSNATLISERIVDVWRRYPPRTVDVTIYGHTAETYDAVADAGAGQHARFRRGIELLAEAGVAYSLKAVAIRANSHELQAIYDFASALGKELRIDAVLSPRIDGGLGPLAQRLAPADVLAVEQISAVRASSFANYCLPSLGTVPDPSDNALYQCGAGQGVFLIDPYGRLHLCELSRTLGYDVLTTGFAKGWYEEIPKKRAQKRAHDEGCGSCQTQSVCSNCVGMAELEGRIPQDGNPYMCSVSDVRAQGLLGDAAPLPRGLIRLGLPRTHVPSRVIAAKLD